MLIGSNLLSGKTDWWVIVTFHNGDYIDLHHASNPFRGTPLQLDMYIDGLCAKLSEEGLSVKEIETIPIKRSK